MNTLYQKNGEESHMARLPKIRTSYYNDAHYLLRLIHALQRDTTRPPKWIQARIAELQNIATAFLNAPAPTKTIASETQSTGR